MQNNEKHWEFRFTLKLFCQRIRWLGTICILLNRGVNVGGVAGWYTPPDICFSRSPNECIRSQNINPLNRCDLIARDNRPTNFGCINVLSIDL